MDESKLIKVLSLPCPSCGGKLGYSAEKKQIWCQYCGHAEDINRTSDKVVEQELHAAISYASDFEPEKEGRKVYDCKGCGSKITAEPDQVRLTCGFCGSQSVNEEAFEHKYIQPNGIIPFYIARQEASDRFKAWIGKGFFTPSKLKKLSMLESLHGVYLPFWTFDAQTESDWTGEAGYHYYETETYYVNGKLETRQVQRTRWEWKSGHHSQFFDDILVVGSKGYPHGKLEAIYPFRLQEVVNFDSRLLVGWETEVYSVEVDEGYNIADRIMDGRIQGMCSSQLGGDTQRNLSIDTTKSGNTFKHLLLPVWIFSYTFNSKVYQVALNGQTGKIAGQKPVSALKIILLILLIAAAAVGIYFLIQYINSPATPQPTE